MEDAADRPEVLDMRAGEIPLGGELKVAGLIAKLKAISWSLRKSGAVLVLLSVMGVGWIYTPLVLAEINYQFSKSIARLRSASKLQIAQITNQSQNSKIKIKNLDEYSIYIPKISARSRVIPNVDAGNSVAYMAALKQGVAEAAGLAHPGKMGTTYLFAHSTDSPVNFARYNAVFYLLDKLSPGDEVEVVYMGELYKYVVRSTEVLSVQDTRYLVPQKEKEQLVLQTCYPPGTSWKRLVVVLDRVGGARYNTLDSSGTATK